MKRAFVFVLVFTVLFLPSVLAQTLITKKELRSEWMVYKNDRYEPLIDFTDESVIYFSVNAETYAADKLQIEGLHPVIIFINGKLAGNGKHFLLSVDSVSKAYSASTLLVAVYGSRSPKEILTRIVTFSRNTSLEQPIPRESASFRDFAILASLLLIVMLAVITRTNPKLASDYLSFKKIFSLREADDSKIYSRVTSSTNILFYIYCSLVISYYLFIIFHFVSDRYPAGHWFQSNAFGEAWIQWLKLTAIVLIILFLKIILVFGLSLIFGVKEVAAIHFFNLVRMLVVCFGLLTIGLFVYFIGRGYDENVHAFFLKLLAWIMMGWMILIFLKLSGKMSTSMFHLFSYICATELIPFLIIVKVLYN